ncbi:MAG TPA: helix-turn-helix domain-containing GNAT family N-acetyltransferase [Burkholderiaceae bacterium]|jgi:DNA-binding MarR family transcriptional regulator/GNAT superfamily N-acetyltransferase|nr:helix-turn-helix domain-containing GNAT family N-acetyltransferase [Burkholderiaceae bacterium]
MGTGTNPDPECVAGVRRFSRFYTQRLGLLEREILDGDFSLTESRVLWELTHRAPLTASQLCRDLGLNAGYLSRLLRRLRAAGLVRDQVCREDARAHRLSLTAKGGRAYAQLDLASRRQVARIVSHLPGPSRRQLIDAMDTVRLLMMAPPHCAEITFHEPSPGDMGWVVQRHGALYAQEFGWDIRFEAFVARVAGDFIEGFKPGLDRGWIARREGVNVGCVFVMQAPPAEYGEGVAKLRMLLVDPAARGQGLGDRLVRECEQFSFSAGYRRMTLWTNSILHPARRIYERNGWQLVNEEPHSSFGHDLVGQTWMKELHHQVE